MTCIFYLGLHMPSHLERIDVPACVSYGTLRDMKTLPQPNAPVFLDSRGFSEISEHGRYTFAARDYAAFVRRCRDQWGQLLVHASIMDWMCEPFMLVKTRMSVGQHQTLTVNSWLRLNALDGQMPWVPVLQGWTADDYLRHADYYERHTCTRLADLPLVGVGSVCRRQRMQDAAEIIRALHARGLHNLHGFGFKITGLVSKRLRLCNLMKSADSTAWSRRARNAWEHDGNLLCGTNHDPGKSGCRNCLPWAMKWRNALVARIERAGKLGTQCGMFC
jgi:hypothetical protein